MAGIDWLRLHHGTATDPKLRLVAKRAGVRPGDVVITQGAGDIGRLCRLLAERGFAP